jgi:hypothetical protein
MSSVFLAPDGVDQLSATIADVATELETRAGVIDGLLAEAGKSSSAPGDARATAELLLAVGDDMALRAELLRTADAESWPREVIDFLLGDVGNFWGGGDGSMPWGKSAAGLMRTVRGPGYLYQYVKAARAGRPLPPAPTTANGGLLQFIGKRMGPRALALLNSDFVAGLPSARNASLLARGQGGLRTLAPRAGLARGLGVAGGVVSTGLGVANLIEQGNPVEAFKARGTEYAADVASTASSASSTAFFVAPTPFTAGATIVTGVAWLGLEAWNHREEIAEVWNDATDAVGDFAEGAADVAEDVGGFLNPFD